MSEGWIKLHRCLRGSIVYQNSELLHLWIELLLKATHKEHEQLVGIQKIILQPGQLIVGRKRLAEKLKMSESKVYRYLKILEDDEQMITVNSNNKFSLVTITEWDTYQSDEEEIEQQMNSKRTTNEQQMNTNKNVKRMIKNDKEDIPYQQIIDLFHSICKSLPKVKILSEKRKKLIKTRFKKYPNIETYQELFTKTEESNFLSGRNGEWSANFDWLLNETNMIKVLEGNYVNKITKGKDNYTHNKSNNKVDLDMLFFHRADSNKKGTDLDAMFLHREKGISEEEINEFESEVQY